MRTSRDAPPAGPLPSGRHRLSREQVVTSQRNRMMAAMADAMREKGYIGTPVSAIIKRAGVSRETFYQQFRSKEDCFLQALDSALQFISRLPDSVTDWDRPPADIFRELLRKYLQAVADQPALARLFLVEVYAVGPEAFERRRAAHMQYAEAIAEIFHRESDEARFLCEAVVSAAAQLATDRIVANDIDGLRALEEPLAEMASRLLG
ncbi:TetR/AcrR family transcriptional regulator [Streptomyces sp. NA04227]|uniref:TetR/AcrR family transcriptional regulator n=1 Tax=Streptomyces sp. NA04227 TaxID=2742136 RepID=UPI0015920913|nr:TetR/AcrR family transcriptional regulator [Streptomyces sp. NA04227]QKW09880.1 TetR/AcrR family transcriptional regulator [Streptomyces sp. NA04227]